MVKNQSLATEAMRTHSAELLDRGELEAPMAEIRDVSHVARAGGSARGPLAMVILLVLLLGSGMATCSAFAQAAVNPSPAAKSSPAAAATPQRVEDIVVTAQKREQLEGRAQLGFLKRSCG